MGDNSLLAEFEAAEAKDQAAGKQAAHRPAVLADGSYATQTALADNRDIVAANGNGVIPNVRHGLCLQTSGLDAFHTLLSIDGNSLH